MKRICELSIVAALCLSLLAVASAQTRASSRERQERRILKKVQASSASQIFSDNTQGSELYVQVASVKEITLNDFRMLTGEPSEDSTLLLVKGPRSFNRSTFPDVTLSNNAAKTITSFTIGVQSSDEPTIWHILLKNNLSMTPNSTYKVASNEWTVPEKVSIEVEGKFVSRLRRPGLESAKSWIRGPASSLRVAVAMVGFEDGTKWKISPDYGN